MKYKTLTEVSGNDLVCTAKGDLEEAHVHGSTKLQQSSDYFCINYHLASLQPVLNLSTCRAGENPYISGNHIDPTDYIWHTLGKASCSLPSAPSLDDIFTTITKWWRSWCKGIES